MNACIFLSFYVYAEFVTYHIIPLIDTYYCERGCVFLCESVTKYDVYFFKINLIFALHNIDRPTFKNVYKTFKNAKITTVEQWATSSLSRST